MAKRKNMSTTWNREDRDLLVELRTEVAAMRADLQDIKGNFSARLLALEGNVLMKVVYETDIRDREKYREALENRIRTLENSMTRIYTWGSAGLLVLGVVQFLIGKFL